MAGGGENDINLVPYMDILLNLIMFMVFVTQTVGSLHQIPVVVPEQSGGGGGGGEDKDKPKQSVVAILKKESAVVLCLSGAACDESSPLPLSDRTKVGAQLQEWAKNTNIERRVDFVADPASSMSDVIAFMDIAQDPVFAPTAGGTQGPFPDVVFTQP
jgi:biopolymer transport protein ExbD